MKYVIKSIDSVKVVLENPRGLKVEVSASEFDSLMISVGQKLEVQIDIPFAVSAYRRSEISAHHAEEALNGDI